MRFKIRTLRQFVCFRTFFLRAGFYLFCFLPLSTWAATIDTFYGPIEVEEPILLELIESPPFQRLKWIHQYGVAYYTTHKEEYTRYDHSLGVFAILRIKNSSLEEQIAGLLHDVSHTVFSHVGDWIFRKENQDKDYQSSIHKNFLEKSGLGKILGKYGFSIDQILPTEKAFPSLEQKLPNLCADRIDYNIQGAYHQGFITYEEAKQIIEDLQFIQGSWVSTKPELMKKLVRFSLFMTQNCWGSAENYNLSRWLAEAILRMVELERISYEDIHFSTDQVIWDQLTSCEDLLIQKKMQMIAQAGFYYSLVDPSEADIIVKSRFRVIDPYIFSEGKIARLTHLDPILAEEYRNAQEKIQRGWAIKYQNLE